MSAEFVGIRSLLDKEYTGNTNIFETRILLKKGKWICRVKLDGGF